MPLFTIKFNPLCWIRGSKTTRTCYHQKPDSRRWPAFDRQSVLWRTMRTSNKRHKMTLHQQRRRDWRMDSLLVCSRTHHLQHPTRYASTKALFKT